MRTVLITGASSGIGKETAYVFAENNFNLVLVARRLERLKEIQEDIIKEYLVAVDVIELDLSKLNSANELFSKTEAKGTIVDILINNAGFGINSSFVESDDKEETEMQILNMITLTKLSKLYAKQMLKRSNGHIINIASTAAFQALPNFAVYAATKSFVLHFSEAIAHELKGTGVNVSVVCPGATQSEFAKISGANEKIFKRGPTSRDLAEFIFNTSKSNKTLAIQGFKNKMLIFSQRFSPRKLIITIAAKIME